MQVPLQRIVWFLYMALFTALCVAGHATSVQFTSLKFNDTRLRYVVNSGICETTPGVTQYSGYITVGKNMSMVFLVLDAVRIDPHTWQWFWFFEARTSPETAPFTLWWVMIMFKFHGHLFIIS